MSIKIDLKTLKTIEDVVKALRRFSVAKETLSNDHDFLVVCETLLERFGTDAEIEPTDPGKVADLLESLPIDTMGEDLTDILTDLKEVGIASEEKVLGPKSLNSKELKQLLLVVEEHDAKEKASKIAEDATKKRLLNRFRADVLEEIIKVRQEVVTQLQNNGVDEKSVGRLADQVMELEQTVRGIIGEDVPLTERSLELTEQIVMMADGAKTTAEAVNVARNIKAVEKVTDANEMLAVLVEAQRAENELKRQVDVAVNSVLKEIEEGGSLGNNRDKIQELIQIRFKESLRHPEHGINESEFGIENEEGKIVVVKTKSGLAEEITTLAKGTRGTITSAQEKVINEAVEKHLGAATTDLTDIHHASAATGIKDAMASLTKSGFNAQDLKAFLMLRTGVSIVDVEVMENNLAQEHQTKTQLRNDGVPAIKIKEADNALITRGFLESKLPVKEILEKIDQNRTALLGNINTENQVRIISKEPYSPTLETESLVRYADKLKEKPELINRLESLKKIQKAKDFFDRFTNGAVSKAFGNSTAQIGRILKIEGLQNFGMQLVERYGGQVGVAMAQNFVQFGFEQGLQQIISQLIKTGTVTAVKVGTTAGAEVAVGATAAAGATVAGGPPTWAIMAALYATKQMWGAMEKNLGRIMEVLGFDSHKVLANLKSGLGKTVTVVGGGMLTIGGAIASLGGLLTMAPTAMIGSVFAIVFSVLIGYNLFQVASTQVSSLVVPSATGGNGACVKQDDLEEPAGGKLANCNVNAPATNYDGVDKEAFVSLAESWSAGGSVNAARCFNDVVCQALNAGINPTYALWAWLHESGASNYGVASEVADFGMASIKKPNDFTAQISEFLKLGEMGTACPGLSYWLSFATNYLTGDCDPTKEVSGVTGNSYLAEMETTWGWLNAGPMPATYKVPAQKCGGGSSSGTEETDPNTGDVYVCYGGATLDPGTPGYTGSDEGSSEFDPNAPGLEGEDIAGECSVSSKVVLTKQCGQAWSNKGLPGGSGTICSAGCGPTSISMILRTKNGSLTPDSVIFAPGSAYSSMNNNGSSLTQASTELNKYFPGAASASMSCDAKAVAGWICAGKIVMVLADFYNSNSATTVGGHFVLGVAVQNGSIVSADPYYATKNPFNGTKKYGYARNIRGCITIDTNKLK